MNPKLQKKLIQYIYGHYQNDILYFFEDFDANYKASDDFTFGILRNLECIIVPAQFVIIDVGEMFDRLFFIIHGGISVYDVYHNFLTQYEEGSNIGEFQIMLGVKSEFKYQGYTQKTSYLLGIKRKKFLECLY